MTPGDTPNSANVGWDMCGCNSFTAALVWHRGSSRIQTTPTPPRRRNQRGKKPHGITTIAIRATRVAGVQPLRGKARAVARPGVPRIDDPTVASLTPESVD